MDTQIIPGITIPEFLALHEGRMDTEDFALAVRSKLIAVAEAGHALRPSRHGSLEHWIEAFRLLAESRSYVMPQSFWTAFCYWAWESRLRIRIFRGYRQGWEHGGETS